MNRIIKKGYTLSKYIFFPLVLLIFPLIKVTRGVDLTDTSYSLGNYVFFDGSKDVWFLLTYISNAVGHLFTQLPFGGTLIGMKVYGSLTVSVMALFAYRFFSTKMPSWLAFLAEVLAIGMCWAPTVILYNYLTYFFLLGACVMLFRGLAGTNRSRCLVYAGLLLGINTFVRFPGNGLEVLLIFALWYYGMMQKKDFSEVFKQTMLCFLGYVIAFGLILLALSLSYGSGTFGKMISGVFGISGANSEYTFGQMLMSVLDAYWHGFKWALYMIICVLPGIPFMLLWPGKYMKLRKIVYCVCIGLLFFVLYKWGMYNFKYYQKESALQWGAIFLLISIVCNIWMMASKSINYDWKLIGAISLIVILITPLGSNNYIWPALNNLFFIAPVTLWIVYRFVRWGRNYLDVTKKVPLFAPKAMLGAVLIAFFIQAVGVGAGYIFLDGEDGTKLNTTVSNNEILKGSKTTMDNAYALSEISEYFMINNLTKDRSLILYGDIPGLSYYLDMPSALNTSWSDLGSNPVATMETAINSIDAGNKATRPIVVLSRAIYETPDNSIKLDLVNRYINDNDYETTFMNDRFVVFE